MAIMAAAAVLGARIAWQDAANQITRWQGKADAACGMDYCDHALFWLAGRLSRARDFTTLYQPAQFMAYAAHVMPGQVHYLPFVYPPPMLLPAAVISWGGLAASYYASMAGLTALALWLLARAGLPWLVIALGVLSPAGLWAIYLGQFGVFGAAVLLAGLAGARTRPRRSGGLLALLCLKPQYGLLVPVVLLAGRNWSALGAFAITAVGIVGAALFCFGPLAFADYFESGRLAMRALLEAPFGPGYEMHGISVFWMLRSFGAGLAPAYAGQIISAALAVGAAWWLWRRAAERTIALILCLNLLVSPYGFTDDLVGYSLALAMLLRRDAVLTNAALAVLWLAPGYTGHLAARSGLLITPLLVLAALAICWLRLALPAPGARPHEPAQFAPPARAHSPR